MLLVSKQHFSLASHSDADDGLKPGRSVGRSGGGCLGHLVAHCVNVFTQFVRNKFHKIATHVRCFVFLVFSVPCILCLVSCVPCVEFLLGWAGLGLCLTLNASLTAFTAA